MKFSEACAEAVRISRETGYVFYVYDSPSLWHVTSAHQRGWLFKVYPGGRKIVSLAGSKILKSEASAQQAGVTDVARQRAIEVDQD